MISVVLKSFIKTGEEAWQKKQPATMTSINAGLWIFRYGALQVNGTKGNEVTFQGDRREANYTDEPGQWDRIWFNEGKTDNWIMRNKG